MAIDPKRSAELAAHLARHFPAAPIHLIAEAVVLMQREARAAKARATRIANHGPGRGGYDAEARRDEKGVARCRAVLETACVLAPAPDQAGAFVTLGGDPRGPCGWLHITNVDGTAVPGDGFGDGFAIY